MPVTVTTNGAPADGTDAGEIPLTAGMGLFTVNVRDAEGAVSGFTTVMACVPPTAMDAASTAAMSCVLLLKVVGSTAPSILACELLMD